MLVVGLTGSIAMGKTTTSAMLRAAGYPVYDADAAVHALLGPGGAAVAAVAAEFPGSLAANGGIDRVALGARVFGDTPSLRRLEAILHPLVRRSERRFLKECRSRRVALAILDIPLLFESGGDRRCDAVIVASAPAFLQRARALRRAGMDETKLAAIMDRQMPDHEKRRRTPYVVQTGLGRHIARRRLMVQMRRIRSLGNQTA